MRFSRWSSNGQSQEHVRVFFALPGASCVRNGVRPAARTRAPRARRSTRSPRHARRPLPACLMHLGLPRGTRSPRHARRPLPACLMHLGLGLPRASALAPPSLSSAPSPRTRPVSAAHLTPRCSAPAPCGTLHGTLHTTLWPTLEGTSLASRRGDQHTAHYSGGRGQHGK